MAGFLFDEKKGFEANLDAFLHHMADEVPEFGAHLRAEAVRLKGAVDEGRRRAARTDFNAAIKAALDKMLASPEETGRI